VVLPPRLASLHLAAVHGMTLALRANEFASAAALVLQRALRDGRALAGLDLSGNDVGDDMWVRVLEACAVRPSTSHTCTLIHTHAHTLTYLLIHTHKRFPLRLYGLCVCAW
jgi:hypothetical protein